MAEKANGAKTGNEFSSLQKKNMCQKHKHKSYGRFCVAMLPRSAFQDGARCVGDWFSMGVSVGSAW